MCIINIKDNKTNISYEEENIDWSKYETKEIKLTESLTITNPGIYILSGKITGNVTINTNDYVKLILNWVEITNNDGPAITIDNGQISIIASDDVINVAGGSDSSSLNRLGENNFDTNTSYILTINDGYIYVNADGDGLDSNGKIIINGGTLVAWLKE